MHRIAFLSLATFVVAALVSIAGGACLGGEQTCDPGRTSSCACPGGAEGAQTCDDDGSGWGDCACEDDDDDDADAGPEDPSDAGPEPCDDGTPGDMADALCDTCNACAQSGPCSAEANACWAEPDCGAYSDCVLYCGDDQCAQQCETTHAAGAALYMDYVRCFACDACPVNCGTDTSDPFCS